MVGKTISIINIVSSSKMEHTSTSVIGGVSTGIIYIGVIPIYHTRVGDYDVAGKGNADDAENSIISSSSSSYWGRNTKRTKEEIVQRRAVCVNKNRSP